MRMILALCAMVLLNAIGVAAAQDMGRLAAADANGDGALTRAEARAARESGFARLDGDSDGYLSSAERENAGRRMAARLARGDDNNDGRISRAEFMAQPMPAFDRFDRNDNDVLDADELDALRGAARTFGAGQ